MPRVRSPTGSLDCVALGKLVAVHWHLTPDFAGISIMDTAMKEALPHIGAGEGVLLVYLSELAGVPGSEARDALKKSTGELAKPFRVHVVIGGTGLRVALIRMFSSAVAGIFNHQIEFDETLDETLVASAPIVGSTEALLKQQLREAGMFPNLL